MDRAGEGRLALTLVAGHGHIQLADVVQDRATGQGSQMDHG